MKTITLTDPAVVEDATAATPVKVCMLFLETPARTESRVMRDATALVEAGYDVTLIDIEADRTRHAEEEIRGVRFRHIFMSNWYSGTRFKLWYLVKLAWAIVRSTLRAIQTPADIYHAHNERALPAGYIAARLRRKPLIFDAPELTLTQLPYSRWRILNALATRVIGAMTPYCAGAIATSPLHARELRKTFHMPEVTLVRNVPSYRAVARSDRLRQQLGLSPTTRVALYQGNLQLNRGLHVLVRAAAFLEQDIVIVIMGRETRDISSQLHSLIDSEGVAERVKIIPPVPYEELLGWTASADIGLNVLPPDYSQSIQLCLPNKLFEYLMAGLPVLTSELDAVAELVRTYDVGRVVSSVEPEVVAAAMNAMLADQEGLARMHRNALEAARTEFCWEKEGQRLFDLYKEILSKQKAKPGRTRRRYGFFKF